MKILKAVIECPDPNGIEMNCTLTFDTDEDYEQFKEIANGPTKEYFRVERVFILVGNAVITAGG